MRTEKEISSAIGKAEEVDGTEFAGMTYEQGIAEALMWVLGDIESGDFQYAS